MEEIQIPSRNGPHPLPAQPARAAGVKEDQLGCKKRKSLQRGVRAGKEAKMGVNSMGSAMNPAHLSRTPPALQPRPEDNLTFGNNEREEIPWRK